LTARDELGLPELEGADPFAQTVGMVSVWSGVQAQQILPVSATIGQVGWRAAARGTYPFHPLCE
jgi:hypothetical protein